MALDDELKKCFSKFTTGVAIASASGGGKNIGLTINSFSSVSLDPALLSFCIGSKSANLEYFLENDYFSINILSAKQQKLAQEFAKADNEAKWGVEKCSFSANNAIIFENSLSYFECKKYQVLEAGDHHIIIGKITDFANLNDEKALIYHNSKYMQL